MNYGLIPVNVCETLYRESGKFGGGLCQKRAAPSFYSLGIISWAFMFLKVTTLI